MHLSWSVNFLDPIVRIPELKLYWGKVVFQNAGKSSKFIIACARTLILHAYQSSLPDKNHAFDDTKVHKI